MFRYIALNNISVSYTEEFIRDYFEYNQIATISSVWLQVNPEPFIGYDVYGQPWSFETQDMVIEIDSWCDTEFAYNIIYNIKYFGGCTMFTSGYGNYIYATHYEMDYSTDDENQSDIENDLCDDDSILTISESGYLTDEDHDELLYEDLTPFQQTQFDELLYDEEDNNIRFEDLPPLQQTLFEKLFSNDNHISNDPFVFGRYSAVTSITA